MQGEELKALRKEAGLTQAGLGQILHLTPAYVGEMERGEKVIEPRTADLAREKLERRAIVGTFREKYVVVLTQPTPEGRRSHSMRPDSYGSYAEAEAAAKAFCARVPGWRYVHVPVAVSSIRQEGDL